ncbi:MAG: hypothetical protein IKE55_04395 [Kiritimatiellae bacterium]|nr:hypothetical protein [Kiritimatiellia bacterium]
MSMTLLPLLAAAVALSAEPKNVARTLDAWSRLERHPATVNAPIGGGDVLSLRGEWEFTPHETLRGSYNAYLDEREWTRTGIRRLHVPGCWEAQGVGVPGMSRPWAVGWDSSPLRLRNVFNGWGWYRKRFSVPESWRGGRIWLKIGGVASEGTFALNGKAVARLNPYCGTWKYDVTAFVRFGCENLLFAEISNATPTRRGSAAFTHHFGGFWRDVEVERTAATHVDDAWVCGDFDGKEAVVHVKVDGDVSGKTRATVEGVAVEQPACADVLRVPLRSFRPWSPQSPNLYTAKIEVVDSGGSVLATRYERFGVRKFETRGRSVFLNGEPFYMRGAGYHHIYPLTGIPLADRTDELRRRVKKIKSAGFNFLRLHTRCEIQEFFDICDEEGMMVEPELPYYHSMQSDGLAFDPEADFAELFENYRRHPSFAMYSLGNEGDFDEACSRAVVAAVRAADGTRPVVLQDGSRSWLDKGATDFGDGPRNPWPPGAFNPDLPFFAHEYMNVCVKLDYRTAGKFSGVYLPPITAQDRREFLARFGLGMERGDKLQNAQNAFQKLWHKYGIELARADPFCDGYSFWSLQDACVIQRGSYSGQAIFDPFFDDKPYGSTAAEFASFNSPSCLLFDTETGPRRFSADPRGESGRYSMWVEGTNRIYVAGESIPAKFLFAHFESAPLSDAIIEWELSCEGGVLAHGSRKIGPQPLGNARKIFDEAIRIPAVDGPVAAKMHACVIERGKTVGENSWPVYLFPPQERLPLPDGVVLAAYGSDDAKAALSRGLSVIEHVGCDARSNVTPGWWWMGSQVGMVFESGHPALGALPKEDFLSPLHMRMVRKGAVPLPAAGFSEGDLVVYGEGVDSCYAYLAVRELPEGGCHVLVAGLDVFSSNPESVALWNGIVSHVALRGGKGCSRVVRRPEPPAATEKVER